MNIQERHEGRRGCGFRQEGGLYLVSEQLSKPCLLLPHKIGACPTCGEGVKYSRSWTWIKPYELFGKEAITEVCVKRCASSLSTQPDPRPCFFENEIAGLLWIGKSFYPTTGI